MKITCTKNCIVFISLPIGEKNEFIICMSENRLRIQTIEEVFPHYENVSAIGCGMNKDVAAPVSVEILSSGQTSSL